MTFTQKLREWYLDRLDTFDRSADRLRKHLRDARRLLKNRR